MLNVLKKEILPFLLIFLSLLAITLAVDWALHSLKILWVGRYLGYVGTFIIGFSFVYSLRKRKFIKSGPAKSYLKIHETLGWLGALALLVHAGIHFNGLLGWLAIAAMLATVLSGIIGQYLLKRSKVLVAGKRANLSHSGLSSSQVDEILHWDSLTIDLMKKWRAVHFPITSIFLGLALFHMAAVLFFGGAR